MNRPTPPPMRIIRDGGWLTKMTTAPQIRLKSDASTTPITTVVALVKVAKLLASGVRSLVRAASAIRLSVMR